MPRKPTKTLHLLAIAKSLEAQNDAIGSLLIAVGAFIDIARSDKGLDMTEALLMLEQKTRAAQAAMWPDDGGGM